MVACPQTTVAGPQPCGSGLVPGEPSKLCEQAAGGKHIDRHIVQNKIGYLLVLLWRTIKKGIMEVRVGRESDRERQPRFQGREKDYREWAWLVC